MCKLSIVIPVYNTIRFLPQCVDSVLKEAPKDCQIILVDDGSNDDSATLCDQYAIKDERIEIIHKKNGGLSSARNVGMGNVLGEKLFFLDSDDYLDAGYFALMSKGRGDLIIGNYSAFYEDGSVITGEMDELYGITNIQFLADYYKYFPTSFNFAWGKIYSTEIIKAGKLTFREGVSMVEDVEFNVQYYKLCSSLSLLPDARVQYRQTAGSLSKKHNNNLHKWYKESYLNIETLLKEKDVFSYKNQEQYMRLYFLDITSCLIGAVVHKDTSSINEILADRKYIESTGFNDSLWLKGIAFAVKNGLVFGVKINVEIYNQLLAIKGRLRKFLSKGEKDDIR